MSFAMMGLTHCVDCMSSLGMNEHYRCARCQEKFDNEQKEFQIRREELKKRETLKAEIVEEVRESVKENLLEELVHLKAGTTEELIIEASKPLGFTFDDWYADIGYKVLEKYKNGNDAIIIKFKKEERQDENKINGRLEGSNEE